MPHMDTGVSKVAENNISQAGVVYWAFYATQAPRLSSTVVEHSVKAAWQGLHSKHHLPILCGARVYDQPLSHLSHTFQILKLRCRGSGCPQGPEIRTDHLLTWTTKNTIQRRTGKGKGWAKEWGKNKRKTYRTTTEKNNNNNNKEQKTVENKN